MNTASSSKALFLRFLFIAFFSLKIQSRSAKFQVVSYEPLYFNLSFSEPTSYPKFQILVNQPAILHKAVSNTSKLSSFYIIEGIYPEDMNVNDLIYVKYKLIFTFPLLVGNGDLQLSSFLLKADPPSLSYQTMLKDLKSQYSLFELQNNSEQLFNLTIFIAVIGYFLAITTVIGLNAFFFTLVYTYVALKAPLHTSFDYYLSNLMLSEPHAMSDQQQEQFLYMCIPIMIISGTFIIGLISNKIMRKLSQKSWFWNQVYSLLTYRLFLLSLNMFSFSILTNLIHLIQDPLHIQNLSEFFRYAYIYFGLAINLLFFVISIVALNPQLNQSTQKFRQYLKSVHFHKYDAIYSGLQLSSWIQRNYAPIMTAFRFLIFITLAASPRVLPNLIIQVAILIYLFTIRPFKYDYLNNSEIGIQIAVVLFYLYLYIVSIYTQISPEITTSTDIHRLLVTNIVFVNAIIFSYFILAFFELYQKIKNLVFVSNQWQKIKAAFYKNNKETAKDQEDKALQLREFNRRKTSITKSKKKYRQPQSQIVRNDQSSIRAPLYSENSEQTDNRSPRSPKKQTLPLHSLQQESQMEKQTEISPKKNPNKNKKKKKQPPKKESLLETMANNQNIQ